jgi:sialate O-acetylesterase
MKRLFSLVGMTAFFLVQAGCHHQAPVAYPLPAHPAMDSTTGVHLPHIFGDHMALQANMRIPIWGSAAANEAVTVRFETQSAATHADGQGHWQIALAAMPASDHGQDLRVEGDHGEEITFHDVIIGEVWLGSGQSNMELQVKTAARADEFIKAANDPGIRLFTVHRHTASDPANDVEGEWQICTPESLPTFSAVLYQFGLNLHKKLGVPVGLIASSWGGTPIQAWTPMEGFTPAQADQARQDAGDRPRFPSQPSVLYNGMIAPIVGYAMRGAIWYQGEADNNPTHAPTYGHSMQTMINLWRSKWAEGSFPFYFVQIAPYGGYNPANTLPILWQQQIWVTKHVDNTGMAATGDIGNVKDIHPKNKHEVGRRLSLIALNNTYGFKKLPYKGPRFDGFVIQGNQIRVHFVHIEGSLKTCDGQAPAWFEIAGADGHFVPAQAKIDQKDVIVWSDHISDPRFVRLGWNQVAEINLCNGVGLPATPFRSDK